jgi:hypothetical protein
MKWEAIDRLSRECCKSRALRPHVRAGFEAELQGIYRQTQEDGAVRFYICVVRE